MKSNQLQPINLRVSNSKLTIRRKNLPEILDISSSTLDGILNPNSPYFVEDFPKPIRLGKRTIVWYLDDLRAYFQRMSNLAVAD